MENDPLAKQKRQELERRAENERKDLEVEEKRGPRPLEGLSGGGAGTTWTQEQDARSAQAEHGEDARRSREDSEKQIPRLDPRSQDDNR
jgi:hypothetical protein